MYGLNRNFDTCPNDLLHPIRALDRSAREHLQNPLHPHPKTPTPPPLHPKISPPQAQRTSEARERSARTERERAQRANRRWRREMQAYRRWSGELRAASLAPVRAQRAHPTSAREAPAVKRARRRDARGPRGGRMMSPYPNAPPRAPPLFS